MSESINPILEALTRCTADEQRQVLAWLRTRYPVHSLEDTFGTTAEVILEAIARASDLSRRGVLGLIAEASFKVNVIDSLPNWQDDPPMGDEPFDFRIRSGERCVRIQVKRQRLVAGKPMRYKGSSLYVAETQRSRKGVNTQTGEDTRPYLCGPEPLNDLDVLIQHGVDPHNVWAVESDHRTAQRAASVLQATSLPIKFYPGALSELFELCGDVFDVVYIDGCAPFGAGSRLCVTAVGGACAVAERMRGARAPGQARSMRWSKC